MLCSRRVFMCIFGSSYGGGSLTPQTTPPNSILEYFFNHVSQMPKILQAAYLDQSTLAHRVSTLYLVCKHAIQIDQNNKYWNFW